MVSLQQLDCHETDGMLGYLFTYSNDNSIMYFMIESDIKRFHVILIHDSCRHYTLQLLALAAFSQDVN